MELEIYEAFQAAGIPNDKAKGAVEAINKAIDQRYNLHSKQLATQGDVEQVRAEVEKVRAEVEKVRTEIARTEANLIKWLVGTGLVIIGTIAALISRLPTI
jgi:peptidoglycan hydrolase CwlO-like protein